MSKAKPTMITINSLDEIPAFASEGEEDAFWATHELSDSLAAQNRFGALNRLQANHDATTNSGR